MDVEFIGELRGALIRYDDARELYAAGWGQRYKGVVVQTGTAPIEQEAATILAPVRVFRSPMRSVSRAAHLRGPGWPSLAQDSERHAAGPARSRWPRPRRPTRVANRGGMPSGRGSGPEGLPYARTRRMLLILDIGSPEARGLRP